MTRQDYILIAGVLDEARAFGAHANREAQGTIDLIACHFAGKLKTTNPRFDSARFLTACGVGGDNPDREVPAVVMLAAQGRRVR